jgi:hypothetical protein
MQEGLKTGMTRRPTCCTSTNMISAAGAENIESFMKAELSDDTFVESSIDGTTVIITDRNDIDTATTAAEHTSQQPR